MLQPDTWIEGGLEVVAATTVWNVRIHIYDSNQSNDRVVQPIQSNYSTIDIHMIHYHDYHDLIFQFRSTSQLSE